MTENGPIAFFSSHMISDKFVIVLTILIAFVVTAFFTWMLIPFLRRMKAGQSVREEGPESHQVKSGTPTMGGLAVIAGSIAAFLSTHFASGQPLIILSAFLAFGALGFFDDWMKVKNRRNLGLTALQKIILQTVIAVGIAWYQAAASPMGTVIRIPFVDIPVDFHFFYIPFVAFVIVSMVNSVNLTDGLDGLAAGVTAIVALFFALAGAAGSSGSGFGAALAGSCLGFLLFNRYPAKVFMGDTGSLALGGGLAAAAILLNMELVLPLVGAVYVMEALSVIIQVASFKLRGKRVFRMSPLHHHFELCGWKETQVVTVFWLVTLALCLITFLLL